jgi:hypothetical protein
LLVSWAQLDIGSAQGGVAMLNQVL